MNYVQLNRETQNVNETEKCSYMNIRTFFGNVTRKDQLLLIETSERIIESL